MTPVSGQNGPGYVCWFLFTGKRHVVHLDYILLFEG
jgi:hypothetical protein